MQSYRFLLVAIAAVSLGYGLVHTWGLSVPAVPQKTDSGADEYSAAPENPRRVKSVAEAREEDFSSPRPRYPVSPSERPDWSALAVGTEVTSRQPVLDLGEPLDALDRWSASPMEEQTAPIDIGRFIDAGDRSAWYTDQAAGDPVEIGDFVAAGGPKR